MESFDVFVLIDAAGDYVVGKDEAAAREAYEAEIQNLSDCDGFRLVKVTVKAALPAVVELEVEAADEETEPQAAVTA